jgi:excisionase family DNA binding protein
MTDRFYTLTEAAQRARISEEELRCAIEDGILPAGRDAAGMGYRIREEDLRAYLKMIGHEAQLNGGGVKRVLIIDDEINFGNLLKVDLMRDKRIQAKFASWGRDGVALAKQFVPDVVLVDFMLPDATGDQVLDGLRWLKEKHGAKILVYSAHTRQAIEANPDLRERLKQLGADDFMDKGQGLRALTRRVYELLGFDALTRVLRDRPPIGGRGV